MIIIIHVFTEKFSFYICWEIFIIIYCQNIEKRKSSRDWKLYRGRARGEAAANMTKDFAQITRMVPKRESKL